MTTPEYVKRATKAYVARLKSKGIKGRLIMLTDSQWALVKVFADCVKQIEDIDDIKSIDVSDDYLNYKLLK